MCQVFPCAHDSVVELDGAMADAELIGAARNGDAAALGALIERHRPGMRAVALAMLGWGPDADDAVQDAILIALSRLGDLRDPAAAGPWLRTITRNAARMRLRSAERKTTLDLPPASCPQLNRHLRKSSTVTPCATGSQRAWGAVRAAADRRAASVLHHGQLL